MQAPPEVSIVVPCYNQAEYLSETLESVLAQTWLRWECILVNDGSTDETEQVAQAYCARDARFRYLFQANAGLSEARNTGIRHSLGTYILPLDSDDTIAPEYLEKGLAQFERQPDTVLVYGLADKFGLESGLWELSEYSFPELLFGRNMIYATALFRRADFERVGGYHANMKGGLEDWDFWVGLLSETAVVYRIPEVVFHYRIRTNSMSKTMTDKLSRLRWQMYLNHAEKYEKYCPNLAYYQYLGLDEDALVAGLPSPWRERLEKMGNTVRIPDEQYDWRHRCLNKLAQLFGLGVIFFRKSWW